MSIFQSLNLNCPNCAKPVAFDAVYSVNADRRPDLRKAILERKFQRKTCQDCGTSFRLDPGFIYIDLKRGQWVAAHPVTGLDDWQAREASVRVLFDDSYGAQAPKAVRAMGARMKPRLVFGWPALREKIVANEAGLDDAALELLKMVVMRNAQGAPFDASASIRLLLAQPKRLLLGWERNFDDVMGAARWVERSLYDEVVAEVALGADGDWADALAAFDAALFVDVDRLLVLQDSR